MLKLRWCRERDLVLEEAGGRNWTVDVSMKGGSIRVELSAISIST